MRHLNYLFTKPYLRLFCAASIAFWVMGCDFFAPPYKAEADEAVTMAYASVSEITACADLGLCANPSSFAEKEASYTNAISQLKAAKLVVSSWAPIKRGVPAEQANENLIEIIEGCQGAVVAMSELHRNAGLVSGAGVTQPVDTQCDQAVRAVRAMK